MGVNQDFATLNGEAQSWANLTVTFTVTGGTQLENPSFSDISWSRSVEVGEQRGPYGGRVMKRTLGSVSQEASITFHQEGYDAFVAALIELAPTRGNYSLISVVYFDLQVFHTPVNDSGIYQVCLKGCRVIGDSFSQSEGTDPNKLEVPLSPGEIVKVMSDGKEVVLL